jgi:hypothetical protein
MSRTNKEAWAMYQDELDALDREYYKDKLDELSYCLPVVRAAKVFIQNTDSSLDTEVVHQLAVAVQAWIERPKP